LGTKLATLGWSPGRDLVFDCLVGRTEAELPAVAATLISHGPDVIWTYSGSGVRAVKSATTSIPIVMNAPDPVRIGLVASLARPGGNVTGFAEPLIELIGKRVEIAREAIPSIRCIGVLGANGPNSTSVALQEEFARVGAALGIEFRMSPQDYVEAALTWAKTADMDAIYIASPFLTRNALELAAGAIRLGLPVMATTSRGPSGAP
jgi:putative ABC transport system substrate-binding protein